MNEVHKKIVEDKGQRPVPQYTIAETDKAQKLDAAVFPRYAAYRITLEDAEFIDIYVSVGDSSQVMGFSD